MYKLKVDQNGTFPNDEDPFVFFHQIIKKDALEAAVFDTMSQADFMSMHLKNLELFENSLYSVKAMLREIDFDYFDDAKEKALARLEI